MYDADTVGTGINFKADEFVTYDKKINNVILLLLQSMVGSPFKI